MRADPAQSSESKEDSVQDEFCGSVENITAETPMSDMAITSYGTRMNRKGRGTPNSLPMITLEPKTNHVFRYQRIDSTNSYVVDVGDIARAIVSASTTTTYRYIMRTFRVKKVTVRGSVGSIGTSATVSLRYLGANTNEIRYQDATFKVDGNAVVSRVPPRFSLASFWHDVTNDALTTPLFEIQYFGTGSCFVDLHMEYLTDVDRYVTFTLAGGTALNPGGLYKGGLAGLAAVGGERL